MFSYLLECVIIFLTWLEFQNFVKRLRMLDSIFPNRLKEDDESPIVENDSLEDGVAALEITQVDGRSNQGIIVHG